MLSGPYTIAISGVFVVALLSFPRLYERLGSYGIIFLVLVVVSIGLQFFLQSEDIKATRDESERLLEPELSGKRLTAKQRKKKNTTRDARGLKFHELRVEPQADIVDEAGGEAKSPSPLHRTCSRDEDGNLWTFSERLTSRSYSIQLAGDSKANSAEGQSEQASADEEAVQVDEQLEPDLFALFSAAGLLDYLPACRKWCVKEGASFIDEVIDNLDDLVIDLGLEGKEKLAIENAAKTQKAAKSKLPSRGLSFRAPSQPIPRSNTLTRSLSSLYNRANSTMRTFSRSNSVMRTLSRTSTTGSVTKVTRTVSYLQTGVQCNEVHVEMDEESDSDTDDEPEPTEKVDEESDIGNKSISPGKKFATIAQGVLFGVRMGLIGKRKREDFEARQIAVAPVPPAEQEKNLTGKSALEMLASFRGEMGCNCITLIIPAGTPTLMSLAKQADGRRTRKYFNMIAAQLPGQGDDIPKNGLGLFLKIYSGTRSTDELTVIEPPRPVRKFALSDGMIFATELLAQLFADTAAAGCVVISGEEACIYKMFEDHAILEARIQPRLQKRQKKGGQSALRIARLAEEVRAAYVRIVAERTNTEFIDEEGAPSVELLAIGGSKELSDNLHDSAHLNYRLQKTMKRSALIKETSSMTEVLRETLALRKNQATSSTSALLREMEEKAHTNLAAYGIKDVSKRVKESNLKKLIFATGCGLDMDVVKHAHEIKSAKVEEVQKGSSVHEKLTREWGGAFALLCWEPSDDYEED